jgi:hypothetical protein
MKRLYSSAGCLYELYTPDVYAAHRKHNAAQDYGGNQQEPDKVRIYHYIFLPECNKRETAS